jgi:dihydroneopterin aldolase
MLTPADKIRISGIACLTAIGVSDEERASRQNLYIDVEFSAGGRRAAESDSIRDAVDYDTVAKSVAEVCASQQFKLIETVAERIAGRILEKFPVSQVRILVRKISPVAAPRVGDVSIEIVRTVSP